MPTGKVKFFNEEKGYGFIEPEEGGPDVFVHASALRDSNFIGDLDKGDRVSFDTEPSRSGKTQAANVKRVGADG